MKIPSRITNVLNNNEDSQILSEYYDALSRYSQILEDNKLYFFEEYTDHGIKHIESVIATANSIIPEQSFIDFFDIKNCIALIVSCILHDIRNASFIFEFRKFNTTRYNINSRIRHSYVERFMGRIY